MMLSVLDLDPVLLPTATIWPIAMLGDQPLQPKFTSFAEQVWPDLALLKVANEDAVTPCLGKPSILLMSSWIIGPSSSAVFWAF